MNIPTPSSNKVSASGISNSQKSNSTVKSAVKKVSGNNEANKKDESSSTFAEGQAAFAERLAKVGEDFAFHRGMAIASGSSMFPFMNNSNAVNPALSPAAWKESGAVASGLGNDSLRPGNRWERGESGYIGGTADLSQQDLKLLEGGKGDGNFSVINSTVSSKVSWMTENGNYLSQELRNEVVSKGKSLGKVFNEIHGRNVGGNSQTVNINGNKLPDDFGTQCNKASHAVFLADLRHGQHGQMFRADFENFKAIALASGVPADKIKVVDNWNDYKAAITTAAKDADGIRERDGEKAQLGLLTGVAAHGYSYGGRGVHDPNAISGFSVRGQDVNEKKFEDLLGMADAHFNNTVSINCPCHSGGFDGKTNLAQEGKLAQNDPNKKPEDKDKQTQSS
ncbi:MAG: hypothetical protein LW817_05115 [Candidatus Caenarcaniphilales bacterium]|jgi:hypothetical protein|nr:hypothetical protein [Candidatus Caenarcaniphilales bacterium]